jgi:glycerol-3-phosphate acyltransferase PlsY
MRLAGLSVRSHWPLEIVAVLLAALIIIRHRENIRRLLRGNELRIEGKSSTD